MIYAQITYVDDKSWKGYYVEFHWENSINETDLWNSELMHYYTNELQKDVYFDGKYLKFKSIILAHLAKRKFIPWGDNIFYKKWLLDLFR